MVKRNCFFMAALLSFFSIRTYCVFSQENSSAATHRTIANIEYSGAELSDNVFAKLESRAQKKSGAKISVEKIPLTTAAFEKFPYNVLIGFPQKSEENLSHKTFIVAATQEDFIKHEDFFSELLEFATDGKFSFDLDFVFTAGDFRNISGNERTMGTEVFCRGIEGTQETHALVLDFSRTKKNFVTPGSARDVSPLYLVRALCSELDKNSVKYDIFGEAYLSLFRLGILKDEARLAAFLSREIPAVMLNMISEKNDRSAELKSIENFLSQIDFPANVKWSRHYIPLKFFQKRIWITERQILVALMAFTALCLLILSDFGFLFRKHSRRLAKIKSSALKSNYLIFLTMAFLAASLFAGQTIASALQKAGARNLLFLFAFKLLTPFFIVSALYPIEIRLHKNITPYTYEYILSTSALLNIFIFSTIDISLFFLFSLEYIILMISRTAKNTAFLYFFMALFFLPFVPPLYSILIYSDARKISNLIFCNLANNIILSFALVPLSLLWLRVLARLNFMAESKRRFFAFYAMASAATLAGIVAISSLAIFATNRIFFNDVEQNRPFARVEDSVGNASVSIFDSEYYGGKIRSIEISSKKIPERYSIFVQDENENPFYFSIYEISHENGRAEFLLPENPPQNLTVAYTPNSSDNSIITVEAYFFNGDSNRAQKEVFSFEAKDGEIRKAQ